MGFLGSPFVLSFLEVLPKGPLLPFLVYSFQTFSYPVAISHLNELSHLFSIIYSFTQYLLSSHCIPGIVLDGGVRMRNRAGGERHKWLYKPLFGCKVGQGPAKTLCVTSRLGLTSRWSREVFWEWKPAFLVMTLSASTFPSIFPYNEPPEAHRGAGTCPRSHSTLRCQASALLRTILPVLVLSREGSLPYLLLPGCVTSFKSHLLLGLSCPFYKMGHQ